MGFLRPLKVRPRFLAAADYVVEVHRPVGDENFFQDLDVGLFPGAGDVQAVDRLLVGFGIQQGNLDSPEFGGQFLLFGFQQLLGLAQGAEGLFLAGQGQFPFSYFLFGVLGLFPLLAADLQFAGDDFILQHGLSTSSGCAFMTGFIRLMFGDSLLIAKCLFSL